MRALLIAKPWRGGLGRYLYLAWESLLPGTTRWLPSYPDRPLARLAYLTDRGGWYQRLVETVARARSDLTLFINHREEFAALPYRDRNILWLTDAPPASLNSDAPYGQVYVSDPGYAQRVRAAVGTARFAGTLPFAHLPELHRPDAERAPATRPLCFIANSDPKRDRHLRQLFARGVHPDVYGNHFLRSPLYWRHPGVFHRSIPNQCMGRIYAAHRLTLNVHARVVREGTNMRTFECAGYGIPQLVEDRPGLAALFEPEREIFIYHEPEELPERVAQVLARPRAALAAAERARKRALSEHTYQQRIMRILRGQGMDDVLGTRHE